MASGDTLICFDATDHHGFYRMGASSPVSSLRGEGRAHLMFPQDTYGRYAVFESVMPRAYSLGGVALRLCTATGSATTGWAYWYSAFVRHYSGYPLNVNAWGPVRGVAAYSVAPAGAPIYSDIVFESNAAINYVQVGEHFRFYVQLAGSDNGDGRTPVPGNFQLYGAELREL